MILVPYLEPDVSLRLDAFSYQIAEIDSVRTILERVRIAAEEQQLPNDNHDRVGRRFIVPHSLVSALEEKLQICFVGQREQTSIQYSPGSRGYRCEELNFTGDGTGCVEFYASDKSEAIPKCALIANNNGWLGGVAEKGSCRDT